MKSEHVDVRDPETYAIIGAALEVHRELGHGFLEQVYQEAMEIELGERGNPFVRESLLTVYYKGRALKGKYKADFVCYGRIVVEAKAMSEMTGSHRSQVINYLKATRFTRGLLINFGQPSLRYERLVWG